MIRIVDLRDFSLFVGQQGDIRKTMLFDEVPVRFSRPSADAQDFDAAGFKFRYVLLKLNKLLRSVFAVILGIEGNDGPPESLYHGT